MILGKRYNDTVGRRQWRRRMLSWALYSVVGLAALGGVGWLVWSYAHREVVVIEPVRTPRGVWCKKGAETCQFWDESGARWGTTTMSIGPLLLLVRDERTQENGEEKLLAAVLAVVDGVTPLGLRARSVTLPDAEPGGARITLTGGYDLLTDLHGDVADQLSTLAVFLADRAKDPTFKPFYIDLRTPGRIYYK